MNTNIKELNLEEMEQVNGGFNWLNVEKGSFLGGVLATGVACLAITGMAVTPAGWVAAAAIAGAAVAGAGTGGGIGAIVSAFED